MTEVVAAVRAVIGDRNKFLAIRKEASGKEVWDLPGGRITYKRVPFDILHLKTKEELGIEIKILGPLGIWWHFPKEGEQEMCFTFLAKPKKMTVNINKDSGKGILEARWVSQEEFMDDFFRVSHGSLKKLISDI